MASVIGKIVFPNGTYQKDGVEKTSWLRCGALIQTDKGMRIKLDALPVNMQEGWFQVFEEDDKPNQGGGQATQKPKTESQEDIPF
jgi:hypothetical protein